MVYAEPSALASSAWNDKQFQLYLGYMHEQVCRVLAFCSFKAHDEIVLEAWGCDGAIPSVEQSEGLAQMFKDALFERSCCCFRKVTFALSRASPQTQEVFRKVFMFDQ